jgi:hypothetical protein
MKDSKRKKNVVSPDSETVKFYYFLVEVRCPTAGHLCAFLVKQAYTGYMSTDKENRLRNALNASYHLEREITGFNYEIVASGSDSFCRRVARVRNYDLH